MRQFSKSEFPQIKFTLKEMEDFKETGLWSLWQHNPVTKNAPIPAATRKPQSPTLPNGLSAPRAAKLSHILAHSFSKAHSGWPHNHQAKSVGFGLREMESKTTGKNMCLV